VIYSYNKTN